MSTVIWLIVSIAFLIGHTLETVWVYRDARKFKGQKYAVEAAIFVFLFPVVGLIFLMAEAESTARKSRPETTAEGILLEST
ncbi:hypothetical protein [Paenibacillus sp. J2TS4]|uniref:hypothetical protein n=1 Tax=Paenibacillus sp. J2TS4 TaxID=2807194 RepID=UPI001B14B015|nr:hypothetical protein [Paenibacillus sp. J2TS4]GIP34066.1 hypothetical protein J2TS4_32760 [Paenibacillus sp. J2TS4]